MAEQVYTISGIITNVQDKTQTFTVTRNGEKIGEVNSIQEGFDMAESTGIYNDKCGDIITLKINTSVTTVPCDGNHNKPPTEEEILNFLLHIFSSRQ